MKYPQVVSMDLYPKCIRSEDGKDFLKCRCAELFRLLSFHNLQSQMSTLMPCGSLLEVRDLFMGQQNGSLKIASLFLLAIKRG